VWVPECPLKGRSWGISRSHLTRLTVTIDPNMVIDRSVFAYRDVMEFDPIAD